MGSSPSLISASCSARITAAARRFERVSKRVSSRTTIARGSLALKELHFSRPGRSEQRARAVLSCRKHRLVRRTETTPAPQCFALPLTSHCQTPPTINVRQKPANNGILLACSLGGAQAQSMILANGASCASMQHHEKKQKLCQTVSTNNITFVE